MANTDFPLRSKLQDVTVGMADQTMPGQQWLGTLGNAGVKPDELANIEGWLKNRADTAALSRTHPNLLKTMGAEPAADEVPGSEVQARARAATPQINEVWKSSGEDTHYGQDDVNRLAQDHARQAGDDWNTLGPNGRQRYQDEASRHLKSAYSGTKYSQYQLPGATNYREMLLTLPAKNQKWQLKSNHGMAHPIKQFPSAEAAKQYLKDNGVDDQFTVIPAHNDSKENFTHNHWDEPNVLAHARMNDRILDKGQKTLMVEELQSDAHQKARKIRSDEVKNLIARGIPKDEAERRVPEDLGYKKRTTAEIDKDISAHDDKINEWDRKAHPPGFKWPDDPNVVTPDMFVPKDMQARADALRMERNASVNGVPNFPFKKTWPELLLKRMVHEAVHGGYDNLAWTSGGIQADRYNLAHHVDALSWNPTTQHLQGWKNGRAVVNEKVSREQLPEYIGDDVAENLLKQPIPYQKKNSKLQSDWGAHVLRKQGLMDISKESRGMRGFYDVMLPRMANKLFGKHGTKVEQRTIHNAGANKEARDFLEEKMGYDNETLDEFQRDGDLQNIAREKGWTGKGERTIHVLPITDALREHVKKHGLNLYASGGLAGLPDYMPRDTKRIESETLGPHLRQPSRDSLLLGLSHGSADRDAGISADPHSHSLGRNPFAKGSDDWTGYRVGYKRAFMKAEGGTVDTTQPTNEELVRERMLASPDHTPAWRVGDDVVTGSRHAPILREIQATHGMTPQMSYALMDSGDLEPGWYHKPTGKFVNRYGAPSRQAMTNITKKRGHPQQSTVGDNGLKPQREPHRWGDAAFHFRGNTYSAPFHAGALDKFLQLHGYPKAKDGGIDAAVKDFPDLENPGLTSDNWGGFDRQGNYLPLSRELDEPFEMPIDLHRARGGLTPDHNRVWWHGSPSGDLRGGKTGLHLGNKESAKLALNARIGIPATGEWDGTREYGKTLLAGQNTLERLGPYTKSGYNMNAPEEDYLPKHFPMFSDGTHVLPTHKPDIRPYRITGKMTNTVNTPHDDFKANGYMQAALKRGNAKNGFFYRNVGEDPGSISAVVPNGSHVQEINDPSYKRGGRVNLPPELEQTLAARKDGWVGVDLDGTLAHHGGKDFDPNKVGKPINAMVTLVKDLLAKGRTVKVFTARVAGKDADKQRGLIDEFCMNQFGDTLPITHEKDHKMVALLDDRAWHVGHNTGVIHRKSGGRINRSHDVPYLAGESTNGKCTYIDRDMPKRMIVRLKGGKGHGVMTPDQFLKVHEEVENRAMEGRGLADKNPKQPKVPYEHAHRIALRAEKHAVHKAGFDWDDYQAQMHKYAEAAEKKRTENPPKDLDLGPYESDPDELRKVEHRAEGGRVSTLFKQPSKITPAWEREEKHNRERFAAHFNYADRQTGRLATYDAEGRYNCGRCNMADGNKCMLLKIPSIDRAAGSCEDWEIIDPKDKEIPLHQKTPEEAVYGVAQNGVGFGCKRCPFASVAATPDRQGRNLYCGKGDMRVHPDACCSINGAPVVGEPMRKAAGGPVNTNPTDAQKEAGNYKKGHVRLHGMDISIENPQGSVRSGFGKSGQPWQVRMPSHYGYIRRTEGSDGDYVDAYIGSHPHDPHVLVVNQRDADTGHFDEHKVMMGYPSARTALTAYLLAHSDGRGADRIHSVVPMHIDQFKDWLKNGDTTKPAGYYAEGGLTNDREDRTGEAGGRGAAGSRGREKDVAFEEEALRASHAAHGQEPLIDYPKTVLRFSKHAPGLVYVGGPNARARSIAHAYMREAGLPYHPPTRFQKVDPERAKRIAQAFDEMRHDPHDPKVRASYEAMARETMAQWNAIKKHGGLQVHFPAPGAPDNYRVPHEALMDARDNNHMWVFPTVSGFGSSDAELHHNPLLAPTGETINGHPAVVNDIFRAVHDYFGHLKEGNGFRANGEDNAWRSHAAMYSPLARPAMTTETRGQNSWVNYGPHAEHNKTASGADTVYADQKIGVMPDWTMEDMEQPEAEHMARGGSPDEEDEEEGFEPQIQAPSIVRSSPVDWGAVRHAASLEDSYNHASSQQFKTGRDFKQTLQDRVRAAHGPGHEQLQMLTPELQQHHLVPAIAQDARFALQHNSDALGWYGRKVNHALAIAELMHPELKSNPEARFAYKYALAVTSNGLKVNKNFELADQAYDQWWKNEQEARRRRSNSQPFGKMPTNIGIGTAKKAINHHLGLFNELVDKHGYQGAEDFLNQQTTAGELKKNGIGSVSGELAHVPVRGSAILGPKIGNGFYQNLNGNFSPLTMDRWLMRTWGRLTGNLIHANPEMVKQKSDELSRLVTKLTPRQKAMFEKKTGVGLDLSNPVNLAYDLVKASQDPELREGMNSVGASVGENIRKSAKMLHKWQDGQIEQPYPRQRIYMRDTMEKVRDHLKHIGIPINMADLQALLWYPEKRLYDTAKLKVGKPPLLKYDPEADDIPDYASAAAKLAKSKGHKDEDINEILSRDYSRGGFIWR